MSRHVADSNYSFHFRPIRGEEWDFKPPSTSTDSGQDRSNDSDASEDEEDGDASSSSDSSSSSRSNDGDDTDASSGDNKSDDEGNGIQDDTASPTASPSDAGKFPDKEPVVSQDLADYFYIEEHDRVLEESRGDFEWTEASFFSQNGDIELQHDAFQVQNTGPGPAKERRSSVGMIPFLPPPCPN